MKIPIAEPKGVPTGQAGRVFSLAGERKRPRQIPRSEEAVWSEVRGLADRVTNIGAKLADLEAAEISSNALTELNEGVAEILRDMEFNHEKYGGVDLKAHEDSFNERYGELTKRISAGYAGNARVSKYMDSKFSEVKIPAMNKVHRLGWGRQYTRGRTRYKELTDKYLGMYLHPSADDNVRMTYVKHHQEMTNAYVAAGYLSEEEAFGYHEKFVDAAATAYWENEIAENPTEAHKILTKSPPESFKNLDEATKMSILATAEKNADAERIANVRSQIVESPIQTYVDMKNGIFPEGWENLNPDEQSRVMAAARIAYDKSVRSQWILDITADPKKAYHAFNIAKGSKEFGWLREPTKRELEVRVQAAYDKKTTEDEVTDLYNKARDYLRQWPGEYDYIIPWVLEKERYKAQSRSQVANMLRTEETRAWQRANNDIKEAKANYKSRIFALHMEGSSESMKEALTLVNAPENPLTGEKNPLTGEERFDLNQKLAVSPERWVTDNETYREISVDIEKGLITDPVSQITERMGPRTLTPVDADKLLNKWRRRNAQEDNPKYTFELRQALKHGMALHKELYPKMIGDRYKVEEFLLDQYFDAVKKKQKDTKDPNAMLTASEYIAINEEALLTIVREGRWYVPFEDDDINKTEWEIYAETLDRVREEKERGLEATRKKVEEQAQEPEKVSIPPDKRATIIQNLRKLGLPPTEALIERMHAEDAELRSMGFQTKEEGKK